MLKRILAGAAAATLAVLAASPGVASAQSAQPRSVHGLVPASHVINLQSAYDHAVAHARFGTPSGIVYAYGKHPQRAARHAAVKATCSEPNCALAYNGGPVQHTPHVYLLLWGPEWSSNSSESAAAAYLTQFYKGLGASPQDTWSAITSQYSDGTGSPTFGSSVLVGVYQDQNTPPHGVTQAGLAGEADAFATQYHLNNTAGSVNDQIVIATQSGTCPQGFYSPNCDGGKGVYCAWHDYSSNTGVTYTNLPYLPDSGVGYGSGCGAGWVQSKYDGFSIVGGHEYAETITDPEPNTGWWDPADANISGGEIGDKCAWIDPVSNSFNINVVTLSTGTFAMQPLFSNQALNTTGDGCVLSTNATNTVTVTPPGNFVTKAGTSFHLQVQASDSASGQTLTYRALGLPRGVSISSTTGLVSGKPVTAGTFFPTVIATDGTQSSSSTTFNWLVGKGRPVKGYKHRCAAVGINAAYDVPTGSIVLAKCDNGPAQLWTAGARKSVQAFGMCLTTAKARANGHVTLLPCNGAKTQRWTHKSNGEYMLAVKHLCLTDPHKSTKNGTKLVVAACRNTANQRWTKA